MQQLATPDAQTHTTLPPPPPTTASTHSSQLQAQAQQVLEGKVRTLERELYYYKKTCRELKKRLRVAGGSTSISRSASSSRTATSCRPSRVHRRDSTSKTPSGSASGTVNEVDESQTSHDRSRGARSMSDVDSMEGERIPLVTRALEGAVDSELSHKHRLETEEADTSLNDSLNGGSGPPQKPGSLRETSETAGSGSASAGQSTRPQQQGSEHNVGSGGAVSTGVVSVGGGSSAETKVPVEVVRKSKRQLRQLRSVSPIHHCHNY